MNTEEKRRIGYREHFYGVDNDDKRFQCFNCKYGKREENNAEMVKCCRWNIVTSEDDTCNAFEFSTYWAFNLTEEDRERRRKKLDMRRNGLSTIEENTVEENTVEENTVEENTIEENTIEEKCITTGQFVLVGSLFSGMLFNSIMASFMEWGIKEWCLTYVVAAVIVGIGTFIWYIIKNKIVNRR